MFDKVKEAKIRLKGQANVTPTMVSRTLNNLLGAEIYFKCENFQRMGLLNFVELSIVYHNSRILKKQVV